MKSMQIVVIFAIAVAVQAKPYYGIDFGPEMDGLGYGFDSDSDYGDSGYGGHHNGFHNQGHGSNVIHTGHDIGDRQNDFDSTVHHHTSSDHNIGGMTLSHSGGHNMEGHGDNHMGHNDYGSNWHHGFY